MLLIIIIVLVSVLVFAAIGIWWKLRAETWEQEVDYLERNLARQEYLKSEMKLLCAAPLKTIKEEEDQDGDKYKKESDHDNNDDDYDFYLTDQESNRMRRLHGSVWRGVLRRLQASPVYSEGDEDDPNSPTQSSNRNTPKKSPKTPSGSVAIKISPEDGNGNSPNAQSHPQPQSKTNTQQITAIEIEDPNSIPFEISVRFMLNEKSLSYNIVGSGTDCDYGAFSLSGRFDPRTGILIWVEEFLEVDNKMTTTSEGKEFCRVVKCKLSGDEHLMMGESDNSGNKTTGETVDTSGIKKDPTTTDTDNSESKKGGLGLQIDTDEATLNETIGSNKKDNSEIQTPNNKKDSNDLFYWKIMVGECVTNTTSAIEPITLWETKPGDFEEPGSNAALFDQSMSLQNGGQGQTNATDETEENNNIPKLDDTTRSNSNSKSYKSNTSMAKIISATCGTSQMLGNTSKSLNNSLETPTVEKRSGASGSPKS